MATPEIQVQQGYVSSISGVGSDLQIQAAQVRVVFNFPTPFIKSEQAFVTSITENGPDIRVQQAYVLAIYAGRIDNPKVLSWTYTLDSHDIWVLKAGVNTTLAYDTHSGQWSILGSGTGNVWNVQTGTNWEGGMRLAGGYGSNVVVGDNTLGVLYFLDPTATEDDSFVEGNDSITFQRRVYGQVPLSGVTSIPCYNIQLRGSIGSNSGLDDPTIELDYSDTRGSNYNSASTITVPANEVTYRVDWRSLGSMQAPGRLFRLTDYGALARIDSLDIGGGEDGR